MWTNLIKSIIRKWSPITQRGVKQSGQILLKVLYEMVANYTRRWKKVWTSLIKSIIMKWWPITQGGV